jgi:hypothetical protein
VQVFRVRLSLLLVEISVVKYPAQNPEEQKLKPWLG